EDDVELVEIHPALTFRCASSDRSATVFLFQPTFKILNPSTKIIDAPPPFEKLGQSPGLVPFHHGRKERIARVQECGGYRVQRPRHLQRHERRDSQPPPDNLRAHSIDDCTL